MKLIRAATFGLFLHVVIGADSVVANWPIIALTVFIWAQIFALDISCRRA